MNTPEQSQSPTVTSLVKEITVCRETTNIKKKLHISLKLVYHEENYPALHNKNAGDEEMKLN